MLLLVFVYVYLLVVLVVVVLVVVVVVFLLELPLYIGIINLRQDEELAFVLHAKLRYTFRKKKNLE